jgi:hypothetical protein
MCYGQVNADSLFRGLSMSSLWIRKSAGSTRAGEFCNRRRRMDLEVQNIDGWRCKGKTSRLNAPRIFTTRIFTARINAQDSQAGNS